MNIELSINEALYKIRNKTCVPSYLWQCMIKTDCNSNTALIPMRRSTLPRIESALITLRDSGLIHDYHIEEMADESKRIGLRIIGISALFFQTVQQDFPAGKLCDISAE
ncbi:MAG: hypothetical protein HQL54_05670 [Magnetococcales bacterium]|nr:hypothetical protein [Magnetococcales bacterium]